MRLCEILCPIRPLLLVFGRINHYKLNSGQDHSQISPIHPENSILTNQWFRYHAHTKPHFVFSIVMGLAAPVFLLATPLRDKYLYKTHNPIPHVYPLPTRERDASLSGYDDE